MFNYEQVDALIIQLRNEGKSEAEVAWQAALACVGWPYVYGAWGALCTPAERRKRYSDSHPTIKSKCQNFSGKGSCSGCKWLPDGIRVRCFDCRGFTYWILKNAYGTTLKGQGATSQWNTESNWAAKGVIADMPKDTLVCLFVQKGTKMNHTGLGLNNETVECSNGVQHFTKRNKKWTHWAIPAGGQVPAPDPDPEPDPGESRPTLRRGSTGAYVKLAQAELINRGYDLGSYGADGKFGKMTEAAVRQFQADRGLTVDGVIGPATWEELDAAPVSETYTVTIPGVPEAQANALCKQYPGATLKKESGD